MKKINIQILFAVLLVFLGTILLLENLDIYDALYILKYVPLVFILFAIYLMIQSGFKNLSGPIVIILVFGFLQLYALGMVTRDTISQWWPIILILVGLIVIMNWVRSPTIEREDLDNIDLFSMFGGVETAITSKSFRGGSLTAIFGGIDLDLRDAEVKKFPIRINSFILFGGADIKVPEEWEVRMKVVPLLGGASDERVRSAERKKEGKPELEISGLVMFGGISVKD